MARAGRSAALLVLLGLLAAGSGLRLASHGLAERGIDFYQFLVIARALADGQVDPPPLLYSREQAARLGALGAERARGPEGSERQRLAAEWFGVLEPMGTPLFYTALRPLAALPYEAAFGAFLSGSLLAFFASLLWLSRLCGLGAAGALALACGAGAPFEPSLSDVRVANVNRLLCAALALWVWLERESAAAEGSGNAGRARGFSLTGGALAGLLCALKPVVVPLFCGAWLWKLGRRRVRAALLEAAGGALGALSGALVGALGFRSLSAWPAWARAWEALLPDSAISIDHGNYAAGRFLSEALAPGLPWRGLLVLLLAALLAALVARGVRSGEAAAATPEEAAREAALGLGLGFALLAAGSSLVWLHYQVLALPALIAAAPLPLREAGGAGRPAEPGRAWIAAWAAALACIGLQAPLLALGLTRPLQFAGVVLLGDALLAGLCLALLWRSAAPRPVPG